MSVGNNPWWAAAVVYQVYPRSFTDSDGDGIGDLPGVTSRLEYLADLGVDAIWLTPFYPSPLNDGGYDVSDYLDVDPRLGTLADFDALVRGARSHDIRVIVDLVPNHCSSEHPLFKKALAAGPGSPERDLFIFRDGRGAGGDEPPNNWPSRFGGRAWTRVTDGQWYLHLFDTSQPDWNWRDPRVRPMFAEILRFWLDRGVAGFRVDVAHGLLKARDLADVPDATLTNRPSPYYHRPEVQEVYREWRAILDGYPADGFPGARTAVGEVWADSADTLRPYLAPGGLPQVFNFELVQSRWSAPALREAIDATHAFADGTRAPWVIGNHDVVRPVTRWGAAAARAAALLLLALPGSAYIYQGEELGLPEVTDIPDSARQDPTFRRTGGRSPVVTAAASRCRGPVVARLSDSPERNRLPRPGHRGCRSRRAGGAAASPRRTASRIPSSPCTGRRCGSAARTPPSGPEWTAATRCAGLMARPTPCSSPATRDSCSSPTSAPSRCACRSSARSSSRAVP